MSGVAPRSGTQDERHDHPEDEDEPKPGADVGEVTPQQEGREACRRQRDVLPQRAGFELRLSVVRRGGERIPRLGDLSDAWAVRSGRTRPDWTRWRALLDHLALHPEQTAEAIYLPPLPAGSPIIDALLAGVADKLADDAGLPRPSWTALVPLLEEPYEPLVRRGVQHEVPKQLSARGLMIDTESLWRDRRTVGV